MNLNKNWRPPAITTGLVLFYILLRVLGASDAFKLTPDALFHFDFNRLSFYPLVFSSWAELALGVALFTPICGQFELKNGTVRTGVVLNVTAFFVGIVANILAKLSGDKLFYADFCGTSSWILAFSAILSVNVWSLPVLPIKSVVVGIPAFVIPIVMYALVSIYNPANFLVNGLALLMGFGLGLGYLGFLVEGTTVPIEWIENKIEVGINGLRYIVRFVGEVEARDLRRYSSRGRRASISSDDIPLPLTNPVTNSV